MSANTYFLTVDTRTEQILAAVYQRSRRVGRSLTGPELSHLLNTCTRGSR